MKETTYKKYLKFANMSLRISILENKIISELKKEYGNDEIDEFLENSHIFPDTEESGNITSYKNFKEDIKRILKQNKIKKECEER